MNTTHLKLPDGRELSYTIRTSTRAKYLRMQLHPSKGLVITQPLGVSQCEVTAWVNAQHAWISATLNKLARDHPPAPPLVSSTLPEHLALLATGEYLAITYVATPRNGIAFDYRAGQALTLSGAISDPEHCQQALRYWLRGYAHTHLGQLLPQLAAETGLRYASFSVKHQQTRWGSCSSSGNLNLNAKLVLLPPEWVRYTLIHELCHTVEMNHSKRFWALVAGFVPGYKAIHAEMKGAMEHLPQWAKTA
ncbi:MAG: hypothetical protein BWK73_11980 [Thiothrix lacustris]|uniref:YgjP-like metallopeptidase domain-containing protein n=1 Tax=Thiothrix lacustris TaxID=525917 RepID=A0A1Y1QTI3_9GAMM|nr:MAG: hypothetical protein BWK73_11980 [Thiothrix lacustris]